MRDYDARDPRRKAELDKLLASGAVTQPAVNHAGHCDGGARGRWLLILPSLAAAPPLSYTPLAAAPPQPPSAASQPPPTSP